MHFENCTPLVMVFYGGGSDQFKFEIKRQDDEMYGKNIQDEQWDLIKRQDVSQ